jgi:hypothetical protein
MGHKVGSSSSPPERTPAGRGESRRKLAVFMTEAAATCKADARAFRYARRVFDTEMIFKSFLSEFKMI